MGGEKVDRGRGAFVGSRLAMRGCAHCAMHTQAALNLRGIIPLRRVQKRTSVVVSVP